MSKKSPMVPYEKGLDERLKDDAYAAGYLNEVLTDPEADVSVFLLALADVARAHGITKVSKEAGLHRVAVHKMLQDKKDPRFGSVVKLLRAIHLGFTVGPRTKAA